MLTYSYINRVPKSCTHDPMTFHALYSLQSPNIVPPAENMIERSTRQWRNIFMAKGTAMDVTGNLEVFPDYYMVTRCFKCDNDKINRWNEAHWHKNPWERRQRFATWLAAQDFLDHTLSEIERQRVIHGVRQFHLTRYDFKLLDEQPYHYVIKFDDVGEREWHYKLRQTRNVHNNLFDVLKQNEKDGYGDDNKVPPISLVLFNDMD